VKENSYEVTRLESEGTRHEEEKCTRIVTSPSTDNLSYARREHFNAPRDENESLN